METHLKAKHNMTMKEYKEKYNNPILIAEKLKMYGSKNPFYKKKHPKELQNQINESLKVSMNSPKTQAKLRDRDYKYMRGDNNPAKRDDVKLKVSEGVKNSYNPELKKVRSDKTKEVRANESPEKRKQRSANLFKSMVESGHWVDPSLKREFDRYKQKVLKLTERQFKLHFDKILFAEKRSNEFCLDHKLSIYDAFHNNIMPEIVSHWKNFEILSRRKNSQKHTRSSISLQHLLQEINHASKI